MKRPLIQILLLLTLFAVFGCADSDKTTANSIGKGFSSPKWDQNVRAQLQLPESIMSQIAARTNFQGNVVGFTEDEMSQYSSDAHCLDIVKRLFKNASSVPRYSGRLTDLLLAHSSDNAKLLQVCFSVLGERAGSGIIPPTADKWGCDGVPDSVPATAALSHLIEKPMNTIDGASWNALPRSYQKLVVRLVIAAKLAQPYLDQAYDKKFLASALGMENLSGVKCRDLYSLATEPWEKDFVSRTSYEAMEKIDLAYLEFASILYNTYVDAAIKEFHEDHKNRDTESTLKGRILIETVIGKVAIYGTEDNKISGEYSLVIDLGGNDEYCGIVACPIDFKHGISTVLDLGGDDHYVNLQDAASIACGLFGIGEILDLSGDDRYSTRESGIGACWYGVGLINDSSGNDIYTTTELWGQGAAHFGVALLVDGSGDDIYSCGSEAQGFGSTLGVGAIVDVSGDDTYKASDTFRLSKPFGNRPISFAQGAAFGRRADYGDGHSLAGGVGILAENSGNDRYHGNIYSQGTAYWWGLGICEDRSGDDSYHCLWYSLGSAPHFAIGCMVDLTGNDEYNMAKRDSVTQYQGCARDGSIGVFIDGYGDDKYFLRNRCAGAGDLNSIGIFWDRFGDDHYITDLDKPYHNDAPFGSCAVYPPFGNFRDRVLTLGVFLDTAGRDYYSVDSKDYGGTKPLCKDNGRWWNINQAPFYGFGLDLNLYNSPTEKQAPKKQE